MVTDPVQRMIVLKASMSWVVILSRRNKKNRISAPNKWIRAIFCVFAQASFEMAYLYSSDLLYRQMSGSLNPFWFIVVLCQSSLHTFLWACAVCTHSCHLAICGSLSGFVRNRLFWVIDK